MSLKLPRCLAYAEIEKLCAAAENCRDRLIIKTFFCLGLRLSELASLKQNDVDYKNGFVKVVQGKGSKDRLVPIPCPAFAFELRRYAKNHSYDKTLFGIKGSRIEKIIKACAVRAGLRKPREIHPHTLRHSYATFLFDSGVPLNVIQACLGHEYLKTTTIYVHLGLKQKRAALEQAFANYKTPVSPSYPVRAGLLDTT